jgi:hypothetical protein
MTEQASVTRRNFQVAESAGFGAAKRSKKSDTHGLVVTISEPHSAGGSSDYATQGYAN